MLEKWKNTILAVVSAFFVIAAVWGYTPPLDEITISQLIELIFLILGGLGLGAAAVFKFTRKRVE